jgi:hypothetical protein
MRPRLASKILVNALIRRAESLGGFGVVIARGDPTAGSILLVLCERGEKIGTMERVLEASGDYIWQLNQGQDTEKKQEVDEIVHRRRKFDPDLWVLELDIPSPERFAAEMTPFN